MSQETRPGAISWSPHLFEILILVQFVVFQSWAASRDFAPGWRQIAASTLGVGLHLMELIVAGIVARAVLSAFTGTLRDTVAVWLSRAWLATTARLIVFGSFLSYEYTWMKLLVPVLHDRNFDDVFWKLDSWLLLGHSPNILFLNLFGPSGSIRFFDRWYGELFITILLCSIAFILSSPDRARRITFANGLTVLWLGGVWMYVATPSVGPCYAYAQAFAEWWESLPYSVAAQRALFENYGRVLRVAQGESLLVNPVYGVAAFPSLHVGLVAFAAILVRKYHRRFQLAGWVVVAFMILGSVVTGWHYLVDSIGGVLLAVLASLAASYATRLPFLAEGCTPEGSVDDGRLSGEDVSNDTPDGTDSATGT